MGSARKCLWLLFVFALAGCGDLAPSGADKRPPVVPGTIGPGVGQIAPDFTLPDSLGDNVALSAVFPAAKGVVLYFTMWCPVCDSQMSDMRSAVIPAYPNARFFAIDYVCASVAEARASEVANGYVGSGFTVLADVGASVLGAYAATMGTTVVVDNTGVILMNEDYRDGSHLRSVLAGLQ